MDAEIRKTTEAETKQILKLTLPITKNLSFCLRLLMMTLTRSNYVLRLSYYIAIGDEMFVVYSFHQIKNELIIQTLGQVQA